MAAGGQGQSYVMEKITKKFLAYWNDQNQGHDYYFQFTKNTGHLFNSQYRIIYYLDQLHISYPFYLELWAVCTILIKNFKSWLENPKMHPDLVASMETPSNKKC